MLDKILGRKKKDEEQTESKESKAAKAAKDAARIATGNDGALGAAKKAISTRRDRLEEEEKKALGYKNGGKVMGKKGGKKC